MSTRVVLTVPVSHIKVHPKNPRRDSVADDGLVASVTESGITTPLLVAVDLAKNTPDDVANGAAAPWVIALDGHRRRDAAKKAKLRQVPVVIDLSLETEVDQLRAMILANVHREDLSPVEVAESYQGLLDLGLKQADVARAMGRKPRDVSAQLKILKLAPTTQAKVHEGTLTLDDAAGLLEFAGNPDTTAKLEQAAESGTDFRFQLQRARQRRDMEQQTAARVAELEQEGVPRVDWPVWEKAPWDEMRRLSMVPGANADSPPVHDGCHGYTVTPGNEYNPSSVIEICTDITKHQAATDTTVSQDADVRAAQMERRREEIERRDAERAAAEKVRMDLVREISGQDLKVSPALEQLIRSLLPAFLAMLEDYGNPRAYEDILNLDAGERWSDDLGYGTTRDLKVLDHFHRIAELPKTGVGRHLAAALLAMGEWAFDAATGDDVVFRAYAAPYVDLLEAHGYDFAGPDADRRDMVRLVGDHAPAADDTGADEIPNADGAAS